MSATYDPTRKHTPVDIVSVKERWSEYTLSDGTIIRIKGTLTSASRAIDQFAPDGDPIYQMQCGSAIHIDAPESLKRPTDTKQG